MTPLHFSTAVYTIISAYANVGETINIGSSVQTTGKILWYAPNGVIGTNSTAGGVGIISNRTQEVAGPLPNVNGYNPRTITVTNGQAGVWEIHFVSPNTVGGQNDNPTAIGATNSWTQPATGGQVAAWDVTVRSSGGSAIPGRVYANLLSLNIGEWLNGGAMRSQIYCLTADGYQYRINLNSLDPYRFQFFANNRGFRDGTGAPLFKSVDLAGSSVKNPLSPDTATDITHKLFFATPAGDLPTNATTRAGSTWLLNPPRTAVTTSGMQFIGLDGTTNQVGSSIGGNFTFNANGPGSYLINIDLDGDGSYTSAVDRVLLGTAAVGANSVFWDGNDGQGNPAPRSVSGFSSAVAVANGEVHFPFADAEGCYSGLVIQRLNGPATNSYTIFWDDSNFGGGTQSLPPNGSNSLAGAHTWLPSGNTGFGNQRGIDTWVFVPGNYSQPPSPIVIKQTDLELVSFTRTPTFVPPTSNVTYTAVIRNNGPDNTPQARFLNYFPPGLTNLTLLSSVFSGGAGITSGAFSNGTYDAKIQMNVNEVGTLTFRGTVAAGLGSVLTNVAQFLTYNDIGDVNDPDRLGAGNNGNTNIVAVTFSVAGFAYSDANFNAARDGGENGTGLGSLYAKLINTNSPATAAQAALVDPSTGAYTLTTTTTGGYTVILDDNNTLADVTANLPAGWLGTEAVGQRRTGVTVNNNVSNLNFGLYNGSYLLLNTIGSPTVLTAAGSVTFSVTVTNTSSISNALTAIVNNSANLPANSTYVNNSSAYNGTAIGNPTTVGVTNLTWNGTFSVPANGVGTLTFSLNFPATLGIYTNRTFARVTNTQIDSTSSTADNAPSIETIRRSAAPNNAPIVSNVTVSVNAGSNVIVNPSASDPDNDPLTLFIVTPPTHGSAVVNALTITYTPLFSYSGSDSFTYRATDGTSNSVLGTASITVFDVTPPTITTCATNLTGNANASCQASVPNFTAGVVASDNSGIAPTITQVPVIGALVGLGTNTVTIRAVDGSANTNTCTASFIVRDVSAPAITTCATNITGIANGSCQATVPNFTNAVVASDCSAFTITQTPAIGTVVGLGTNTVTIRVVDINLFTNTCTASFIVRDLTPPSITTCATNLIGAANASCQATVPSFTNAVVATDSCGGAVAITQVPTIGSTVGSGTNTITIRAVDTSSNTNTCTALFIVKDLTPPTFTCPANVLTNLNVGACLISNVVLGVPASTNDNCGVASVLNNAPVAFSAGTTGVVWTVTDTSGNSATCTQTVTILDLTPPTITTGPTNQTASANGSCQAIVPGFTNGVTVVTTCGKTFALSQNPVAGATGILGTNTVTVFAVDSAGNTNTSTASFIVRDTTAPSIGTCATNQTATAGGGGTASVPDFTASVTATDTCGSVTITQSPTAGSSAGIGSNTVTLTVIDNAGNTNTCTATLVVLDKTPPTITTCAGNQSAEAGPGCQASVPNFTAGVVASDNSSNAPTITQSPLVGSTANYGTNTVTLLATDGSGNSATCTANFVVSDTTAPNITSCPATVNVNADNGLCVATGVSLGSLLASDNCGIASTTNNASSSFSVGSNTVVWTVSDTHGVSATCTQLVIVTDNQLPTFACPAGVVTNLDLSACIISNVVLGVPASTNDNCGIASVVNNAPVAFSAGTTGVVWTVTDIHGNSATCTQTVTILDLTPPTITQGPTNQTAALDASCAALLPSFTNGVTATTTCSKTFSLSQTPAIGASVSVGATTVTVYVVDSANNTNIATATFAGLDVTAPTISQCPSNRTVEATAGGQAAVPSVTNQVSAADTCSGSPAITQSPVAGALVGLGDTTVTLFAVDGSGNTNTCSMTLTVVDTTRPVITVCAPNQQANAVTNCQAAVPDFTAGVTASDNGTNLTVTQVPVAGTLVGFGTHTITLTVADQSSNSTNCTASFTVTNTTAPTLTCPANTTVVAAPGATNAVVTFNAPTAIGPCGIAAVVFTPASGSLFPLGTTPVSCTVTDASGLTASCTFDVTVNAVNAAAIASNDVFNATEDTALIVPAPGVLANDTDAENNPLVAILVNPPAHGTVVLNANGSFKYVPAPNFNGTDSFTYVANDGTANSGLGTVTLNVAAVNDVPVANADSYITPSNTALVVTAPGLLANDTDVEGDSLQAVAAGNPTHGVLVLNPDGSFTYTPTGGYVGFDSFSYAATDGAVTSTPVSVSIGVGINDNVPVVVADAYTLDEDGLISTVATNGVLANDTDADSDPLVAILVAGPAHGVVVLNPDGSFDYAPNPNFNGTDSFTYQANDGIVNSGIAVVTITVNSVNDAPVASAISYNTPQDTVLVVGAPGVLGSVVDVEGDPLTALVTSGPSSGLLVLNANGSFTFTPGGGFTGIATFNYAASDGSVTSTPVTVTIYVGTVNHAPTANNDSLGSNEDSDLIIFAADLLANDIDSDGNPLTPTLVTLPVHGVLTNNGNGSYTYIPDQDFNGTDSFTYKVNDGSVDSGIATVFIVVYPVNDVPVVQNSTPSMPEDGTLIVPAPGALTGAFDVDGDPLTAILVTNVTNGTLTFNPDGSYTYTPVANFNGIDCFTFAATDLVSTSAFATVCINVTATNDAPTFTVDPLTGPTGTQGVVYVASIAGAATDPDTGTTLTYSKLTGPAWLTIAANGTLGGTPGNSDVGLNTFTVRVSDGNGGTDDATLNITVINVNDAPTFTADPLTGPTGTQDVVYVASLAGVATDPDAGTTLTYSKLTGPAWLTIAADGTLGGTPGNSDVGLNTFTVRVSDGNGGTDDATLNITVINVNDPPTFTVSPITAPNGTQSVVYAASIAGAATDPDAGATLTYSKLSGPAWLTIGANGALSGTPGAGDVGLNTFTVQVSDGLGGTATATLRITVIATGGAPTAISDSYTIAEDDTLVVLAAAGLLSNDIGTTLTAIKVSDPTHGTVTLNSDGSFTYTPDDNFNGTDSFSYKANNGTSDSNIATITIEVSSVSGAGDIDLLAGSASFSKSWTASNRDRLRLKGRINPRGGRASMAGVTLLVSVNGTNVAAPVTLDSFGKASLTLGKTKIRAYLSSVTGKFKFSISGADLTTALGLPNATGTGKTNLDILLTISNGDFDIPVLGGIFETPYKTAAGKSSKARFKFKSHRTLTGVFNSNKTAAKLGKSGGYIVSFKGAIENEDDASVVPTGPVRIQIGDNVIILPAVAVNGKVTVPGLKRFRLTPIKHAFRLTTTELNNTGIPLPGNGAETGYRLPMQIQIPTGNTTNIFETIIELKRVDGTAPKWKR